MAGGTADLSDVELNRNSTRKCVRQKGPTLGGVFTVDATPIPDGPNTLAFGATSAWT